MANFMKTIMFYKNGRVELSHQIHVALLSKWPPRESCSNIFGYDRLLSMYNYLFGFLSFQIEEVAQWLFESGRDASGIELKWKAGATSNNIG